MEQTLPDVLRLDRREDWQKQETQLEESAAAVQLSCAAYSVEHERPHSGKEDEADVGIRFLSAASEVARNEISNRADQRPAKLSITRERRRSPRDPGKNSTMDQGREIKKDERSGTAHIAIEGERGSCKREIEVI